MHFEWTLSHNCKKNSGKKLHNVTISSTCCSAGLEARCILSTQLYTQFSKMDHESNIQSWNKLVYLPWLKLHVALSNTKSISQWKLWNWMVLKDRLL